MTWCSVCERKNSDSCERNVMEKIMTKLLQIEK